jgi:hypothetical protein
MKTLFLTIISFLFSSSAFAHGMSAADKQKILDAGYWEYIELGTTHMLTGYDHLLFLLGVVFFLSKFKDIIKFITAFTIGHSITLVFATIFTIKANYFLIDAVIALTVCYKGFENLGGFKKFFQEKAPNLTWMVFIFGLIHGFGLSTRLQQMPLGDNGVILKIISFNIGVEFGQVVALSVMLFVLSGWRKTVSFQHFSKSSNVALIIAGSALFLFQIHGYIHTKYPDEFPLNKDDHHHVHQDMKYTKPSMLENYQNKIELNKVIIKPKSHKHGNGSFHTH